MVETGISVARRSPLPSADDVRHWVGGCLDGLLATLLSEGLRADAFLLVAGGDTLGVLTRRGDLYAMAARASVVQPLDGRTFLTAEEARDVVVPLAEGREVCLQPVWFS